MDFVILFYIVKNISSLINGNNNIGVDWYILLSVLLEGILVGDILRIFVILFINFFMNICGCLDYSIVLFFKLMLNCFK